MCFVNFQSFDSADGSPPHHAPQLPTGYTSGLRKENLSFEETFVSTSGATPFLPTVTSTAAKPPFSRSKAGADIHSMGMSLEDKIIKLLNSSSEVSSKITTMLVVTLSTFDRIHKY